MNRKLNFAFTGLFLLTASTVSSKTVGELLKQADRGGEIKKTEKANTSLPSFNDKIVQKQQSALTGSVDLLKVKPPRTSSFMEDAADDKSKLEKITDQQIQELYKLTQKFKNSSRRGELWLRLAELYVEKSSVIDFRKQSEYDQKLKEYHEGRTKEKPRLDLADARDYNRKAIQLYEWFARDFPKDEKMDQALFFLGYNHFELGDVKKGLQYYTRLTKEYPQSGFVTESHFALAEYFFENEKWKNALQHYQEVAKLRRHRLYGFSTYKLAWCNYRSGHSFEALKIMEKLIKENRESQQTLGDGKKVSKARLEKEGLRDIVLFYGDESDPHKAPDYFNSIAGTDSFNYLEKLAYLYVEKGNREGARFLFNYLVLHNPANPKAFDYKYQIILAFSSATKTKEFREELYSWVRDFGPNSNWAKVNASNTELVQNANRLRETTLKNWVLTQHQTAQNSHSKFSQNLAYEGYKIFLQEFPSSLAIADMHFFFAELLYDMEKFEEAGIHYRWVVENAPQSKYGMKSAENIVLAIGKSIPSDQELSATIGKNIDAVSFSPKVEKFVQVSLWYLEKFPTSEKSAEIKFRVGRLHYQHNQFDKAVPYFMEIVKKYPKTKYAEYSANLLLDIYNLKKDYAGLEKTAQELLAVSSISNSAAGNDVRGVLEKAQFKKAQDLELNKDFQASAAEFESFAKKNPKSNLIAAAHFNSAINFERAGQNSKAINSHILLLNTKSKEAESLKPKSRRILAKLYQDAGLLEESARMYRQTAQEAGHDPIAPNLFYNAAVLDEALGHNTEALENYAEFYKRSKSPDRHEVLYQQAQIHHRLNHNQQATEKYKEYFFAVNAESEKTLESAYWVYDYNKSLQKVKETEIWKRKVLAYQKKLAPNKKGVGAGWAAKIHLADATLIFHQLKNIKIPNETSKQKKVIQKKLDMLNELNSKLLDIIKYDSADEIVGSLILLGRANQHMGDSFVDAPTPAGLKPQELKMYKDEILKLANPFYAKAKESFKTALDRGSELEAYGKDYNYAKDFVRKQNSSVSVEQDEQPLDVRNGSWMLK